MKNQTSSSAQRSACDTCRKMKEKCVPVLDNSGEINDKIFGCTRCYRLDKKPCTVAGVAWLEHHKKEKLKNQVLESSNQAREALEVSSGSSLKEEKSWKDDKNLQALKNWFKSEKLVGIKLTQMLKSSEIHWLIVDYFWRGEHFLDALVHRDVVLSEWLTHPMLIAAMVLVCFDRKGVLTDGTKGPEGTMVVEPAKMDELERLVFLGCTELVKHVANENPNTNPTVPFTCMVEAMIAVRLVQVLYSRQAMREYCVHHCLVLEVFYKWDLYKMDSTMEYWNAYLQDLWLPERDIPHQSQWRSMFRQLIWATKVDDFSYQAIPGGVPRITNAVLVGLIPVLPSWVMMGSEEVLGSKMDFLVKDRSEARFSTLKKALQGELLDGNFKTITLMVSSGIGECTWKAELDLGAYQPFHELGLPEGCSQELYDKPLKFWLDLIDDVVFCLPGDLSLAWLEGDMEKLYTLAQQRWGPVGASQFAANCFRLLECRTRCRAWIPPMGMVPFIRGDVALGLTHVWQALGKDVVVKCRHDVTELISNSHGPEWFKLMDGCDLEDVLTDAILMSQLVRRILRAKVEYPLIPVGQTQFTATTQILVVHLSVLMALAKSRGPDWVVQGSIQDVETQLGYLHLQVARGSGDGKIVRNGKVGKADFSDASRTVTFSTEGSEGRATSDLHVEEVKMPWIPLLEEKLATVGDLDMDWIGQFYMMTVADMMGPNTMKLLLEIHSEEFFTPGSDSTRK